MDKDVSKFIRIMSILPQSERKLPVIKLEERIYTWDDILNEVKKKTKDGERLLKELKKMGLL
ncbi:MAG: hypothetical protein QXF88_01280 [Candidatus Aenigmatarchaeota archaeon]